MIATLGTDQTELIAALQLEVRQQREFLLYAQSPSTAFQDAPKALAAAMVKKQRAEKRLKAAEEYRDRTLAEEMQARHVLQELQRRRRGPSPEPGLEIQRVTVQMANTLSALRQLATFTDDGGVVVDPARVPCVSSQRHRGVSPARTRSSTTLNHVDISGDDPYMESAASCTSDEIRDRLEEARKS